MSNMWQVKHRSSDMDCGDLFELAIFDDYDEALKDFYARCASFDDMELFELAGASIDPIYEPEDKCFEMYLNSDNFVVLQRLNVEKKSRYAGAKNISGYEHLTPITADEDLYIFKDSRVSYIKNVPFPEGIVSTGCSSDYVYRTLKISKEGVYSYNPVKGDFTDEFRVDELQCNDIIKFEIEEEIIAIQANLILG